MTVGTFCTREVVVASKEADLLFVAKLMRQHHVGDVVVIEKNAADRAVPLGVVTDRDLVVEILAKEVPLDSVGAGDIMSHDLVTAQEQDSLWGTIKRMASLGIRRMVVVNDQGELAGMLTVDDLIELLAEELTALSQVAGRGQTKEQQGRP